MARGFKGKKTYGMSKTSDCPFCGKIAIATTKEGLNVCRNHKESKLEVIKCTCKSWLEQKAGKFGPYFHCINCGNINFAKAMEMKSMMLEKDLRKEDKKDSSQYSRTVNTYKKKIVEITTDDWEYFN